MFSTPFLKRLKNLVSPRQELSIRESAKLAPPFIPIKKHFPMEHYTAEEMKDYVYDLVRTIADPEKPYNLEDLNIVYENGIEVTKNSSSVFFIKVEFKPTIAHCSLATLIGLCINVKLKRNILAQVKLTIRVKKGTHVTEDAVNKQINDKERVAAAMENPTLQTLVENCIREPE